MREVGLMRKSNVGPYEIGHSIKKLLPICRWCARAHTRAANAQGLRRQRLRAF